MKKVEEFMNYSEYHFHQICINYNGEDIDERINYFSRILFDKQSELFPNIRNEPKIVLHTIIRYQNKLKEYLTEFQ